VAAEGDAGDGELTLEQFEKRYDPGFRIDLGKQPGTVLLDKLLGLHEIAVQEARTKLVTDYIILGSAQEAYKNRSTLYPLSYRINTEMNSPHEEEI
jgi:hypothetical protein